MKYKTLTQEFITLSSLGPAINVQVRYSNRARRVSIRIGLKGAELILPNKNHSNNLGHRFLLEKESWIRQKLEYVAAQAPIDKTTIPFFGEIYSLRYIDADHTNVLITNDTISVYSTNKGQEDILRRFLKNKLLEEIMELATFMQKKHNLIFSKIKLMDNKSKWGSCSSKAALSFNWRLVFAPRQILQYLVAHEMCHIEEMNHGQGFWNLVKEIYPDYKAAKLWLKENSHRLHQYFGVSINRENIHTRLRQELAQA